MLEFVLDTCQAANVAKDVNEIRSFETETETSKISLETETDFET